MAMTYSDVDPANTPITTNLEIDTGAASPISDRSVTFTPVAGYVAVGPSADYGVGSTPAVRPTVFENPSFTATIDPGLVTNG